MDQMALDATRRFVLRCAKYVSTGTPAVVTLAPSTVDNKVLPADGLNSKLRALFDLVDGRYLTSSSLDVDNITIFGSLLDLETLSTSCDLLFPSLYRTDAVDVPANSDGYYTKDIVVR